MELLQEALEYQRIYALEKNKKRLFRGNDKYYEARDNYSLRIDKVLDEYGIQLPSTLKIKALKDASKYSKIDLHQVKQVFIEKEIETNSDIEEIKHLQRKVGESKFKNRGKCDAKTSQKYTKLVNKHAQDGLYLLKVDSIGKINPKSTTVSKEVTSTSIEGNIDEGVKLNKRISQLEALDRQIDSVLLLIQKRLGNKQVCIGRSHTFITSLQELLKERRVLKNSIYKSKSGSYTIRTRKGVKLLGDLDLKYNKREIKTGKFTPMIEKGVLYKSDLLHIIHSADGFNMNASYKLCLELGKLKLDNYSVIKKLNDIF